MPSYLGASAEQTMTQSPGGAAFNGSFTFTSADVPAGTTLCFIGVVIEYGFRNSTGGMQVTVPSGFTGPAVFATSSGFTFSTRVVTGMYYGPPSDLPATISYYCPETSAFVGVRGRAVMFGYRATGVSRYEGGADSGSSFTNPSGIVSIDSSAATPTEDRAFLQFTGAGDFSDPPIYGSPTVHTANGFTTRYMSAGPPTMSLLDQPLTAWPVDLARIGWDSNVRWATVTFSVEDIRRRGIYLGPSVYS